MSCFNILFDCTDVYIAIDNMLIRIIANPKYHTLTHIAPDIILQTVCLVEENGVITFSREASIAK